MLTSERRQGVRVKCFQASVFEVLPSNISFGRKELHWRSILWKHKDPGCESSNTGNKEAKVARMLQEETSRFMG